MRGEAMKVLVAGATGALGKQLLPRLVTGRHDVFGITRSASKQDDLRALGARPIVADALDPDQVARAVAEAEPDVIVHELTALSGSFDLRHFDRYFALTNRLRTEGTDHLLAAGRAAGVKRFVAQSYNRKSTRLNSSHMSISYAVFCLKKKTTTNPESHTFTT